MGSENIAKARKVAQTCMKANILGTRNKASESLNGLVEMCTAANIAAMNVRASAKCAGLMDLFTLANGNEEFNMDMVR